jgi:pyrroloquinoline quinone biosynthesis protein D
VDDIERIPEQSREFTVRDIGDETIFISEKGDKLHTLNDVGSFIWRSIDGKRSVGEIVNLLMDEYDVPLETAREDTERFLTDLEKQGIVHYL